MAHGHEEAPAECCGILLAEAEDPTTATRVLRSRNVDESHRESAYVLDPGAHLRAVGLEVSGEAVIAAYYHSHPRGAARPSASDRRQAHEETVYVIVGLSGAKPEVKAWRLRDGGFEEELLEVAR